MSQSAPHPARSMRYVWLAYLGSLFFQCGNEVLADLHSTLAGEREPLR